MNTLNKAIILFISVILFFPLMNPVYASRETNSFDGNIYPIYAGNGSLVPPQSTLKQSIQNNRTSVLVFYLDDSYVSKSFAPVVSGVKLLWGPKVDLIPLTTDELENKDKNDPEKEAYYWKGNIPQVVVINGKGDVMFDEEGQVDIEKINEAISASTGIKKPDFTVSIKSFNEYNSEASKDGYTDPRGL